MLTIPALTNTVNLLGRQVPVFKLLQHISTVLGALAITIVLFQLPKAKIVSRQFNFTYWSVLTVSAIIIIIARLLTAPDHLAYGQIIVTAISAVLISLVFTPLLTRQKKYPL